MSVVIDFMAYINAKAEEKERIRKITALSARKDSLVGVLHSIENAISVSLVTNHFSDLNQVVRKENLLGNDLLEIIITALNQYKEDIQLEITELQKLDA